MAKRNTRWLNQPLSDHQEQLLQHYIAGFPPRAIALKFGIAPTTVASNLTLIQHKFNAPNRRVMAMLALYDQIYTLPDLLPLTIAALHAPHYPDDDLGDLAS